MKSKVIKFCGWLAVSFYCIDMVIDIIDFPLRSVGELVPLGIRLLTYFLYTIPMIMLLYLSIKYLRSIK